MKVIGAANNEGLMREDFEQAEGKSDCGPWDRTDTSFGANSSDADNKTCSKG